MSTKLYRRFCYFILLFAITILFCLSADISVDRFITTPNQMEAIAQPLRTNPSQQSPQLLLEKGIELYRMGKYNAAIALWQQILSPDLKAKDKAAIHNNLAQAYRQIGQPGAAIEQWQQAISIYRSDADQTKNTSLAAALIEQAQMYSDLGQHRNAIPRLQEAIAIGRQTHDRKLEAAGLGVLGTAYLGLGEYDAVQPGSDGIPNNALEAQSTSLQIARQFNELPYASNYVVTALNNRGNTYLRRAERYQFQAEAARLEGETKANQRFMQLAEQDAIAAQRDYEESVRLSSNLGGITEAQTLLDLNHLLAQKIVTKNDRDRQTVINTNRDRILTLLLAALDSQDKAFALTRLAIAGQRQNPNQSIENLTMAIATARNIDNKRAESFALGSMGYIYESLQQYDRALELTRQAQNTAQLANAADSLYRWQWQAGRILKNSTNPANNPTAAMNAYRGAIATLQTIRGDLISASKELQFDFRDSVEPVYREFIDLLLNEEPIGAGSNSGNTGNIDEALNTLELLKLAELQNFFGDECVQVARDRAKDRQTISDPHTVVIYSIVLDRHTELILRSPKQPLKKYTVQISASELGDTVDRLRQFLENQATEEYLPDAQKVYDLLIRPLEPDLEALKATTLVFINDRELRKLPMAALHDGKQFAIQKYAIATTPSLELTALTAPASSGDRSDMQALILGLTKPSPPFAALPNVAMETTQVQNILGGTTFLDEAFTLERVTQNLRQHNYQILHIATHGKFGANPESTFLVGGGNTRISITDLDRLFSARKDRQAIELLTLSACQTAAGDNRSTLGMAGVAVRAGARSAVATLWFINDAGTVPLIQEFYSQLRYTHISKAEALRKAQIKLIADKDYNHPAIWSPFILIGSWL